MKILVDTNVILDILLEREDFYKESHVALEKAIINGDRLYFSAASVTDVYYVIKKKTGSQTIAIDAIKKMMEFLIITEVNEDSIIEALCSKINDYEDAVVDAIASRIKVDFILTRNVSDFKHSRNNVVSPIDFFEY